MSSKDMRDLAKAIVGGREQSARPESATVVRIDGDTAYVHFDGGADETPAVMNMQADVGDTVTVWRVGGKCIISGNSSAPADVARPLARAAMTSAETAQATADGAAATAASAATVSDSALTAAQEAADVAGATAQHFFDDTDGIHVTEVDDETWEASHTGKNILVNSLGILLRNALNNLVSITASAISFFDGNGNDASNITAQFGADGATIGKSGESHLDLDYHSLQLVDDEGTSYMHVSDLREWEEIGGESVLVATITEQWYSHGDTDTFTVGHAVAYEVSATDSEDPSNTATRNGQEYVFSSVPAAGSTVTITYKTADPDVKAYTLGIRRPDRPIGSYSTAEGYYTTAGGGYSHAEGYYTVATGDYSHAEGTTSYAVGYGSHAEGGDSHANGDYSHAEGAATVADGNESHAAGHGTRAAKRAQTTIGTYNVEDTSTTTTHPSGYAEYGKYAFILGNGTLPTSRSNALTVDWSGNVECGTVNGETIGHDTAAQKITTNSYVTANNVYVVKRNGIVLCYGSATISTLSARTVIGTIPAGYRPPGQVYADPGNAVNGRLIIDASGNLYADTSVGGGTRWFSFTYPYWT